MYRLTVQIPDRDGDAFDVEPQVDAPTVEAAVAAFMADYRRSTEHLRDVGVVLGASIVEVVDGRPYYRSKAAEFDPADGVWLDPEGEEIR